MTTFQKIWLGILSIVCIVTLVLCLDNNQTWRNYFNRENDKVVQDSVALEIQGELIEQAENPSIVDYLQFREDLREQKRVEDVFLQMPTVVIIDILREHGTALSAEDIVQIYENYPEIYNIVQSGARSQQYMDSIITDKHNEPDELPQKAPIDSVLGAWK